MREFSIELPFPARVLFPNARPNWHVKAREVKLHRYWSYVAPNHLHTKDQSSA